MEEMVKYLPNLLDVKIPRCYCKLDVDKYQLFTFSDSSESGMGCVSYLRMTCGKENAVAFVMGKSKDIPKHS